MSIYFDTSAFAKRYVAEIGSDAVDAFLMDQSADDCIISPLVVTELNSILQRLQRTGLMDAEFAARARVALAVDLTSALWAMRPFATGSFDRAGCLLRELPTPLATLDALHLACAIELQCTSMATADRQLAAAAIAVGLNVHHF